MINVICVKHGTKYDHEYVNRLKNMVSRHLTLKHRFICFTENTDKISSDIEIGDLPDMPDLAGWWYKPYIFSPNHFLSGDTNLYFDLDMVIVNNIDHFMRYEPSKFVGLQDLSRIFRRNWVKLGSAVMKWPAKTQTEIWTEFEKNHKSIIKRFRGDQDWIWHLCRDELEFFPEQWIQSYKWQIRDRNDLEKTRHGLQFTKTKDPVIPVDTSILAFHGTPNIVDVKDPVIVRNWC